MKGNTDAACSGSTDARRNETMLWIEEDNTGHDMIEVRASDTDRFYKAGIPFFFSVCQEVGGLHAAKRGLSITEMMEKERRTWIIVRNRIVFDDIPSWGDSLEVITWPQEGFHLYCPRIIKAYNKDKKMIFSSMTHWVVMDIDRKRPIRPREIEAKICLPDKEKFYENPDIGKTIGYDDAIKIETLPISYPEPEYYDIDYNRHINNVVYIRWMISGLSEDFLNTYRPMMVDVSWQSQTFAHDKVYVETAFTEKTDESASLVHRIMRKEEGKQDTLLFEGNSTWKKK